MQTSPMLQPYTDAIGIASKPDVSEIILSSSQDDPYKLVLPMLAHLSHQCENRWFTWVTQSKLALEKLENYAFQRSHIRIIRANSDDYAQKILKEALRNGNSSTVVADLKNLSAEERLHIENAGVSGKCNTIILRLFNQ